MSSLYELTDNFKQVESMLNDSEYSEQAILDTLESIEGEIEDKADGYAKVIKNIESDIIGIKAEETRLATKRKSLENRILMLKNNLEGAMRLIGKPNIKTLLFSFNIQKNGGIRSLNITGKVPSKYMKKLDPVPNNEAIRELLKTGEVIKWASLAEQTEGLRIK